MKKWAASMVRLTIVTTLGLVPVIGIAGAASAVDRTCAIGKFCVYRHSPFQITQPTDYMYKADAANPDWTAAWDYVVNQDSSWRNRWSVAVRVYDHNFYASGSKICVPPGASISYAKYANDDGMSHKWNGNPC